MGRARRRGWLAARAVQRRELCALLVSVLSSCSRLEAPDAPSGSAGGVAIGGAGVPRAAYGLVSVVPGVDRAQVTWRATAPNGTARAVAVFTAEDPSAVYLGAPRLTTPGTRTLVLEGLDVDDEHWFGLALDDGGVWRPVGPVLSARTAAPVFVDAAAPPGGDGRSAATPLDDLTAAVLTAFAAGGGNVWARGGRFDDTALTLPAGVDLYGGFGPGFDLASRDPLAHVTELHGRAGLPVIALESSGDVAVLDGLMLRAGAGALDGVDVDRHPFELRGLDVRGCVRGLRLRNTLDPTPLRGLVVGSTFALQSGPGISLGGALDLLVEATLCVENGQEGLDADDLLAPDGERVALVARDSAFSHNGAEGLDVDLAGPLTGGVAGGRLEVLLDGCVADDNTLDGVLLDLEHEALPAWRSDIVVRGLIARENGGSGLHLDVDALGSAHVHRSRCEGNSLHGLHVTSESAAGLVVASACAFAGNAGAGARAELGNVGLLLSHTVLAGNQQGGLTSDGAPALATSSVAWAQDAPFAASQSSLSLDPSAPSTFVRAPGVYLRVIDASGGTLGLEAPVVLAAGVGAEVAGDDVLRAAQTVQGSRVALTPFRAPRTPTTLGLFAAGVASASEDWRPGAGSLLFGAGMASTGAAAVDVGPFGAPGGGAPGDEGLEHGASFVLRGMTPSNAGGVGPHDAVALTMSGEVDPASLVLGVAAETAAGAPLAVMPSAAGATVLVPPPNGGWPSGSRVLLHTGLRAVDGRANVAPVAVPVR